MEDLVFEFSAPIAATMLDRLANTLEQMGDDAASYIKQASQNEQAAAANEAAAASELATIPNYKEITVEETDEDGEVHEKKERVPDLVADAAARAAAWAFQQAAAALRAIAASLIGTASSLQCSITDGTRQKQQLSIGIENTQFAIKTTGNLLVDGLGLIKEVTSAFNVPQTDNKVEWAKNVGSNLLKIVGVDLSDGLGDELDSALEIAAKYAVRLGDVAFYSAVTSAVVTLGTVPFGNLAQPLLIFESNKIRNMYLNNDTGAKTVKKVMVSALGILGIDATPTKGKTGESNTTSDDTVVIDITEFAKYADTDKTATNTTTQGTTQADVETVKGNFTKTTNQNGGTTVQQTGLSDEAKKKLEDENEKWKAREEYDENRLSEVKNDITRYSNNIKNGNKNISEIDDSIKKKQATIDANKKEYDAKHEEFGKSKMGIDYDGLRKDMENIKKENAQLEKDINLLEKRKELINKNIETWEKNKNTAENVAKSLGGKYEKKA